MKKVDSRIPREVGKGALPDHPAIKTPWDKLISFKEAYEYAGRHHAAIAALFQEAVRIIVPDYEERVDLMCKVEVEVKKYIFNQMKAGDGLFRDLHAENHQIHPFFDTTDNQGGFIAGAFGDMGDERILLCGRVNDFGTYRVEKELDTCAWDIMGSEICRCSTATLDEIGKAYGKDMEYSMVEARGCGDPHCRVIAENRKKYPMPERKVWDNFGPVATEDQIKFTPEDQMLTDAQIFREECNYKYRNGLCEERNAAEMYNGGGVNYPLGSDYCINAMNALIKNGKTTQEEVENIIVCIFEGAGKAMFAENFAIKGLRDWMGVPDNVHDGRVLGGYIEVLLQVIQCEYEIEAFNKDEVVYKINRSAFERHTPLLTPAYLAMWFGATKTLVSPLWSLWEEKDEALEDTICIKIARKIDKFSR